MNLTTAYFFLTILLFTTLTACPAKKEEVSSGTSTTTTITTTPTTAAPPAAAPPAMAPPAVAPPAEPPPAAPPAEPGTGVAGGGWAQSDRDQLINSCVTEAKARAATLDEAKLRAYCTCYEQNIEKLFPNVNQLVGAKAEDMTKAAESCLPLMLK